MNKTKPVCRRSMVLCLVLLLIPALCPSLFAQRSSRSVRFSKTIPKQKELPALLSIRVENDRITADISNCPLQDVLQELADRTGVVFEVRSHSNPLVSVHLSQVSLREAIQRIASDSDTMFIYDQDDPDKISLARLFSRSNPPMQPSIIYLGTGVVTKSNEDIINLEHALKVLKEDSSLEMREKAVEFLLNDKGDDAIKGLIYSINDPTPEIRVAVIEGLAALGTRDALPAILDKLKDTNPGVRQSAATAVALLGDAGNLKDLKPLSSDKDPGVAAAADIAIRKLSAALKN